MASSTLPKELVKDITGFAFNAKECELHCNAKCYVAARNLTESMDQNAGLQHLNDQLIEERNELEEEGRKIYREKNQWREEWKAASIENENLKRQRTESNIMAEGTTGAIDHLHRELEKEKKAHAQTKRITTRKINALKRKLAELSK